MGEIGPFTRAHLDGVVELFRQSFEGVAKRPADEVHRKFQEKFLDSPCLVESHSSVVHVEDNGDVTGFIGVLPQRFVMNGKALLGVLLAELMVAPNCSLGMAGYHITKAAMDRGQDFTFTNRNGPNVAPMWKRLKSVLIWGECVEWSMELSPAALVHERLTHLSRYGKWRVVAPLVSAARPVFELADAVPRRRRAKEATAPRGHTEPLTGSNLCEALDAFNAPGVVRLASVPEHLQWTLDYLADYPARGKLVARILRDDRGKARGFYLFFLGSNGWHQVVAMYAVAGWWEDLLTHLRSDSEQRGGRRLFGEISAQNIDSILALGGKIDPRVWGFYVNSPDPAIVQAFRTGDTRITGLEGEMSI